MTRNHRRLAMLLALATLCLLPRAARAQEQYTYTASLLGGLGGSPDVDPGDDLDNSGFQLNLGMVSNPRTHVDLRLGKLSLDSADRFGSLTDAELSYATIGGEYRYNEGYYESGVYLALGGYRLEGDRGGQSRQETSLGLALGLTGEFRVTRWMGVLVELSGHYTTLDETNIFAMGHAGLTFHF